MLHLSLLTFILSQLIIKLWQFFLQETIATVSLSKLKDLKEQNDLDISESI